MIKRFLKAIGFIPQEMSEQTKRFMALTIPEGQELVLVTNDGKVICRKKR